MGKDLGALMQKNANNQGLSQRKTRQEGRIVILPVIPGREEEVVPRPLEKKGEGERRGWKASHRKGKEKK